MFKLVYGLDDFGPYSTFEEAFYNLYSKLMKDMEKNGGMSWQFIETSIWIENGDVPTFFYDARDHACRIGLLVDGKINEEMVAKFQ